MRKKDVADFVTFFRHGTFIFPNATLAGGLLAFVPFHSFVVFMA